jgi:radical SAM superfamily enzyme
MIIHRITGDGPRDTLIEPKWSLKKFEVINAIDHLMMDRDTWQGKEYSQDKDIRNMFI